MVVGVIGHVDHGKTSLVRALTGLETDRLPEEKRRGISIALGFAHMPTSSGDVDFIDMPGHERFVRTMVSGATGLDAVLVVVAANEGIKPQTVEHLDIAGLLGISRAIVAISKSDLVPHAQATARIAEITALAETRGLSIGAAILTAVPTGAGIQALRAAVLAAMQQIRPRPDDGFPYLPIDRVFSMPGHGTVATGTLRRGRLAVSDTVEIVPSGQPVRLRGLQVHGAKLTIAEPGQRVAVNLRDVPADRLTRGAALTAPATLPASSWLTVSLTLVENAPTLASGARLMLLFGTEEVAIRLRLLNCNEAIPGATIMAQLQAERPVSVPARERFILRRASPPLTIGGGRIIDPQATRQRRHAPAIIARLTALADANPPRIVQLELQTAAAQGITIARLAQLAGVSPAQTIGLLQTLSVVLGRHGIAVQRDAFELVTSTILRTLQATNDALSPTALARPLTWAGTQIIEEAIHQLVQAGTLRQAGGAVALRRVAREQDQAARETAAASSLAEALRRGGLSPPEPTSIAPGPSTRRLIDRLIREGTLVRAPDPAQNRDIIFHQDAVTQARRLLAPLLAPPGLLVKEAGAALGISRKYSVPLLEHLDTIKFTRRVADRRVLALQA